jgi:urea transport system ATP-binding protein
MALLSVSKLNQFYGESHTLWDIDLEVEEGECLVVMGRNGVGKTTLLRCLMGVLPVSGSIKLEARELSDAPAELRPRVGIGYVPQGREIFAQLTVEENLRTGLIGRSDGAREIPALVFELFPVLREMLHRRGGDLSGGQQQQLAFGRALASAPKLLLLDEPTEGIQPNVVSQIGDVVEKLRREHGITVLLVEQKLPFARRLGSRFAILDRGRVAAAGPMSALDSGLVDKHLKV